MFYYTGNVEASTQPELWSSVIVIFYTQKKNSAQWVINNREQRE